MRFAMREQHLHLLSSSLCIDISVGRGDLSRQVAHSLVDVAQYHAGWRLRTAPVFQ